MVVRDAVIENNNGLGLVYSTRSTGQVIGNTIRNNVGDGIRLLLWVRLYCQPHRDYLGQHRFRLFVPR
jgi:hypothetical protein